MRFRLRTLMMILAIGPPALAWVWLNYPRPSAATNTAKMLTQLEAADAMLKALGPPRPFYCGPYDEQGNPCPVLRSESDEK